MNDPHAPTSRAVVITKYSRQRTARSQASSGLVSLGEPLCAQVIPNRSGELEEMGVRRRTWHWKAIGRRIRVRSACHGNSEPQEGMLLNWCLPTTRIADQGLCLSMPCRAPRRSHTVGVRFGQKPASPSTSVGQAVFPPLERRDF